MRKLIDHAEYFWDEPDMSIWEVRGKKENFTYSKIMLWVAFDRALRLADKRNFPLPQRQRWLAHRDAIYELVMDKGFNPKINSFVQSFESNTALDASSLMGPLVFFVAPNDPRFLGTLERILKAPTKGGLTSAGFVFRYDTDKVDDGNDFHTNPICTAYTNDPTRRRRRRRHLHDLHDVADRSTHPSGKIPDWPTSARMHSKAQDQPVCGPGLPRARDGHVRERDQLREPSRNLFRGDCGQWRAIGEYAAGVQSSRVCECGVESREGEAGAWGWRDLELRRPM